VNQMIGSDAAKNVGAVFCDELAIDRIRTDSKAVTFRRNHGNSSKNGAKGKIVCGTPPQTALKPVVGEFEKPIAHGPCSL
jgi:hypothetical protein